MSFFRRLFGREPEDNLRIVITRHGERADLAIGRRWLRDMQRTGVRDPRISRLSPRNHMREWQYDSPLTVEGEKQSASVGEKLLMLGFPIDYCYSSPAFRSIQTANKILERQGRIAVPINIEPGLFECPAWYSGKPLVFIPPYQLAAEGRFNVDSSYIPMFEGIDPAEDERLFYRRSRRLIRTIIRTHKRHGGTILLSGHGGSIEAVTRGLRGLLHRRGDPERLIREAMRVNYCDFAVLERDARTRQWTVRTPGSAQNPFGMQLAMQTTIPLYGIDEDDDDNEIIANPVPSRPRHSHRTHHHQRPSSHHRHHHHHHRHHHTHAIV